MIIGVPKEIKSQENRVGITPAGVDLLVRHNHKVLVENQAGINAGFSNQDYIEAGAEIINNPTKIWKLSDMIIKVKEPQPSEYKYFREDLILFTYLHLANEPELTKALLKSNSVALAYETVQLKDKTLPLLAPMSEIAGKLAIQQGAIYLESTKGGKGKLIDGAPGVPPAHVVVVGGGIVGTAAAKRAIGLGARVTVLDIDINRLRYLGEVFMGRVETLYSNHYNMIQAIRSADLVIGAVLVPGAQTPKIITEDMVKEMEPGGVIVDVAIDQGGSVETIQKPTTHQEPVFIKHGILHYAVANIPASVAHTSTLALTNVSISYVLDIANQGWKQALINDSALAQGANIIQGKITNKAIAQAHNMDYVSLESILL